MLSGRVSTAQPSKLPFQLACLMFRRDTYERATDCFQTHLNLSCVFRLPHHAPFSHSLLTQTSQTFPMHHHTRLSHSLIQTSQTFPNASSRSPQPQPLSSKHLSYSHTQTSQTFPTHPQAEPSPLPFRRPKPVTKSASLPRFIQHSVIDMKTFRSPPHVRQSPNLLAFLLSQ